MAYDIEGVGEQTGGRRRKLQKHGDAGGTEMEAEASGRKSQEDPQAPQSGCSRGSGSVPGASPQHRGEHGLCHGESPGGGQAVSGRDLYELSV